MDLFTIILLLIIGAVLIVVELLLMPGSVFVGLLGVLSNLIGIALGYHYFGTEGLFITSGLAVVINAFTIRKSFLTSSWGKLILQKSIDGKASNTNYLEKLHVGNSGITVSTLRPVGKADFHGDTYEVHSKSGLIEAGKNIIVTKIENKKIYVQEADTTLT